ncbi:hypothetical protein B0H63DRAFT_489680 [Podospora didyma]|uniref:Mid2 domain-containing protein n=1 Tax=Podospora didyma TaxID=330526 RepID=A0AAE0K1A2_9PEZI|nr:hypothetical protein B0H63DRAFT_489680 [Podospora didyma]
MSGQNNGCYFPNGVPSTDIPCDSTAPVSMCCGGRSSCLSSGLCLLEKTTADSGISYARGTCTDATWKSPFCPQHCRLSQETARGNTSAYDFRAGGVQVWECIGEGYAEPAAYCCESIQEKTRCCQTAEAVFLLPGATVGNAASVQTFSSTSSRSSTTSQSTTSPGRTSSFTDSSAASTSLSSTPVTGNSLTGSGAAVDSAQPSGGGGGGLSREATLGIAIAIPLVLVALVAGLVFLWCRRKRQSAANYAAPSAAAAAAAAQDRPEGWQKPELDGNGMPISGPPKELAANNEAQELDPGPETMIAKAPGGAHGYYGGVYGNQPVELETRLQHVELDSARHHVELGTGRH